MIAANVGKKPSSTYPLTAASLLYGDRIRFNCLGPDYNARIQQVVANYNDIFIAKILIIFHFGLDLDFTRLIAALVKVFLEERGLGGENHKEVINSGAAHPFHGITI